MNAFGILFSLSADSAALRRIKELTINLQYNYFVQSYKLYCYIRQIRVKSIEFTRIYDTIST